MFIMLICKFLMALVTCYQTTFLPTPTSSSHWVIPKTSLIIFVSEFSVYEFRSKTSLQGFGALPIYTGVRFAHRNQFSTCAICTAIQVLLSKSILLTWCNFLQLRSLEVQMRYGKLCYSERNSQYTMINNHSLHFTLLIMNWIR